MVVKEVRGRRRYILFSVSADVTKESLIRGLRGLTSEPPYIVQCVPGKVIIRCSPDKRDETISLMERLDGAPYPIVTSGTLKTIRDKYPELRTPKKHLH